MRDKEFKTTHASYISAFRVKRNVLNLMFYPIFLFRRLVFAAIVVVLSDFPCVQLGAISVCTIAVWLPVG